MWLTSVDILTVLTVLLTICEASDITAGFKPTTNGIEMELVHNTIEKLVGTIGIGRDFSNVSIQLGQTTVVDNVSVTIMFKGDGYDVTWETSSKSAIFKDCYDLNIGMVNWYGGPERQSQKWPIEKLNLSADNAYVVNRYDNFAVAERYWLNSRGAYIFVEDTVPLFVDQNNEEQGKLCLIAKSKEPYIYKKRVLLKYTIILKRDPKEAHLHAVNNYLGKPSGHPDKAMIKQPIWTTWARYYRNISDEVVLSFAQDIVDHGFRGGQLEIDDDWERCYGAQEFKSDKFANIADTIKKLKELDFRVTLWVHPFVNNDCQHVSNVGLERGYFVKNATGSTLATWWNGNNSHQIDFTYYEAADWFSARLKKLQSNLGIDNFKFDAGETNYGPEAAEYLYVDTETIPNILTESYVRTCAKFGNIIEVRSAWRTQDLPIFTRMIDKDSRWDDDNGLYTLITTLLQMNMNGYSMVLPDIIGGNGYNGAPSLELLIRWIQATTFMPAMQFSFLPWDIKNDSDNEIDGLAIVKKFVKLHEDYSYEIIKAMDANIKNGSPVNPPIWWVDPKNREALATDTEFLLGDKILVAPVIIQGATSRDIYLPKGIWKDANEERLYIGPKTLRDYPAPIDILPYFIKLL